MTRKLALLLAACLGLWHGSAWALGLGEIEVRSALNERFSAEIDLRRVEALSQNEIIASLASSDDFSRLGVQRFFYLSELEFTTDLSDPARPKIVISSNRPINEPFVQFVVDVRWPTGRMLREYTVLLDPPAYAERPTPAMRPAQTASPSPSRTRTESGQVRTEAEASPGVGRFDGDSYGVTDRDDTLWAIALEVRPSTDVSVQQTMLALQRLNPDAFIRGNINLLKAGYILDVPSADEIARLSRQDAVVQVAEHNARWRDGTPAMPVDARPEVAPGERGSRPAGELRLVAGEDDDVRVTRDSTPAGAGAGAGNGDAAESLRAELAEAESRLSEAEAERLAAEQQREQAANELEELNRQLEVRNQELARLQRQLAQQQQTPAAASRPAAGPLGTSWMLIAAGLVGLIIIVAAVLLLLRRRRAQSDDELAVEDEAVQDGSKPIQQTQLMSAISKEDLARAGIGAAAAGGAAAAAGDDESDVIAEADVYMAYGRFSEAARVLNSAIEADGQRADLRLKLMEVLVETQDVAAFNAQAEALRGFADDQTIALADDLASRLPGAVTSTGATSQGESAGPTRVADEGEVSLDFDLGDDFGEPADLDSLDIDFDASNKPKPAAPADAADDDDLTLLLDGDDDAGVADEVGSASAGADAGADTDGELDLDFDFDEPKDAAKPAADEQGDALDLGLELDGDELSLDETLDDAVPTARDETVLDASDEDDFDFDLPAEDAAATGSPKVEQDDEVTLFDEPRQDAPASSEPTEGDPEFDLTMDGTGFVERPAVAATEADEADMGDLDFDLASGAGDAAADVGDEDVATAAGQEKQPSTQSAATESADDDDLSFDFDIEDLPADTPEGGAEAQEDLSATVSRAPEDGGSDDDSEDVTELRYSAADDDDADLTEFSLDGFEDDAETSAPASAPVSSEATELPVDLADDDLEFGMDFDEAGDETTTKLELARAYIDMGDEDGAKEILDEVVRDGNDTQQQEAAELLARLG